MTGGFGWLDGVAPPLPGYNAVDRLQAIVGGIKAEIESYLRAAVDRLPPPSLGHASSQLWLAALCVHRYGAIYWASRHDALALRPLAVDQPRC